MCLINKNKMWSVLHCFTLFLTSCAFRLILMLCVYTALFINVKRSDYRFVKIREYPNLFYSSELI